MFRKIAFDEDSVLLSIKPPENIIALFEEHFDEDALEGVGPHITLLYLGKQSAKDTLAIVETLEGNKGDLSPMELSITGAGRFRGDGSGGAVVALVNGANLPLWFLWAQSILKPLGVLQPPKWGLIPHMTLRYEKDPGEGWEAPILAENAGKPWLADAITVTRGNEVVKTIKLQG